MNKGLIPVLVSAVFLLAPQSAFSEGEIYKIVNPDGSITFTDQKPGPGAQPVELKPLSVVETDIPVPETAAPGTETGAAAEPTAREMKRMFRDFAITQPQNEETFWGTGNQVTIAWGASEQPLAGMTVVLYVDGKAQEAPGGGSVTQQFDRGEHQVYAVLRDTRNRRIVTTDTVTFFVKQHSVNFNRPVATPRN